MTKHGRGGGAPGKGNAGDDRGGNRGSKQSGYEAKQPPEPKRSNQSAGKEPGRGKGE
jgi:hypothetical protein